MPIGLYRKAKYPPKRRAAKADSYRSGGSAWQQELRNAFTGSSVSIRSPRQVRAPGEKSLLMISVNFSIRFPAGEETKNPKRDIPLAIIASLFLSTIAYCGIATVLTLMWPYYSQVRLRWIIFDIHERFLITFSGPRSAAAGSLRKPGNADDQDHCVRRGNFRFVYQVRASCVCVRVCVKTFLKIVE